MLLHQGADVDLILRLLAGEFRVYAGGQAGIYANKPKDIKSFRFFRQAVLHLSSIQDRNGLFAEPLMFDEELTLSTESMTADQIAALHKEYTVVHSIGKHWVKLSKKIVG
jgi:hypothetical protein